MAHAWQRLADEVGGEHWTVFERVVVILDKFLGRISRFCGSGLNPRNWFMLYN